MAISDDFTVDLDTGDIRHVSGSTVYSVLDLHAFLMDEAFASDGIDNDTPSVLSGKRDATKPAVVVLPNDGPELTEFNLDDTAAQFLNFGSVEQEGADVLRTGLKTLGNIEAASPMYVVQDSAKLTKYWADGHIQILVKAKDAGALIDNGDVTVFSREYGQTFSHFDVNLAAGSEQVAAINTVLDGSIALSEAAAIVIFSGLTVTVGDTNQDLGNGNGSKLYKGTIDCNGQPLADVYQALMAATSENSVQTVAGVPGWRYRVLDGAYAELVSFPFGPFQGGTWFVARGWWITNYQAGDAENFQLTADDGTTQAPPTQTGITMGNLIAGDRVFVARTVGDVPGAAVDKDQFTLAAGNDIGDGTIVIQEAIPADTPATGTVRIGDDQYPYTSWALSTFTLSGTLSQSYIAGEGCYVPFLDTVATGTTASVSVLRVSDRGLGGSVRRSGVDAIVPFPVSATLGAAPVTINAVRVSEV